MNTFTAHTPSMVLRGDRDEENQNKIWKKPHLKGVIDLKSPFSGFGPESTHYWVKILKTLEVFWIRATEV